MFDKIDTLDTVPARELAGIRRRAEIRYRCHLANPALVTPCEPGGGLAWVRNLSVAGVGLVLEHTLEVGRLLEIELITPAGARIRVEGRVVHVTQRPDRTWLAGCEFLEPITPDQMEELL